MDGGGGDYRKMMKLKREGGGEGEIFTYYLFPCSGLTCALFREGGGGRGGRNRKWRMEVEAEVEAEVENAA